MDLNDEIAKVAYELFERGGKEHGKDQAHWLEAERIVKARHEGQTKKIREEKSRAAQQKTSIVRKTAGAKKTGRHQRRVPSMSDRDRRNRLALRGENEIS